MRVRIAGIAALFVVLASFAISGQSLPRTPWGDPDLEGVWTTEMLRDARVPYRTAEGRSAPGCICPTPNSPSDRLVLRRRASRTIR